ncbi:MAG: hypothetical protein AB7E27_01505 [Candidatus Methanomethylophilaceae archaeon]
MIDPFLGRSSAPVLNDRGLILTYISATPVLYTLCFFAFWSLPVVSEASSVGLSGAAVYAALFCVANAIGCPLGGLMADRGRATQGWQRPLLGPLRHGDPAGPLPGLCLSYGGERRDGPGDAALPHGGSLR